jgi:hypothetical protein
MIKALLPLALLLAAPAAAQTVEAGETRWDQLPPVKKKHRPVDASFLTDWTHNVLRSGECSIPGMTAERFDVSLPYAVYVEPDGTVKRILVSDTGCPGLNTVLGSTVHEWAQKGDFRPTGEPEPLWYRGRIAFARE